MTLPCSLRHLRRDDQGVSLVLGAMLITGLALIAFATYQTQVTPQLTERAQHQHLQDVTRELSVLAAEIGRDPANRSRDVGAHPIPMGYEAPGLIGDRPVSGALTFEPGSTPAELTSNRVVIQRLNTSERITQPETWSDVNGSGQIDGISKVANLRIKLDEIAREMNGDHVVIEATDADGQSAGSFRLCIARHSPDWDLHYVVKDADGTILYNNADSYFQNQVYAPFWVNVLDPNYRFDQVLASAEPPLTLDLAVEDDLGAADDCPGDGAPGTGTGELDAEYAITYLEATDAGTIIRGGGGLERTDYNQSFPGGVLTYETDGSDGPRTVVLEHGALALEQSEGAVFRMPGRFEVSLSGNIVSIDLDLPHLVGDAGSTTGTSTAIVTATPEAAYRLEGQASNLTLNLTTAYPGLWVEAWRDELDAAGLSGATFEIEQGTDWARVDIWGLLDTAPGSDRLDLFVRVDAVPVQLELGG